MLILSIKTNIGGIYKMWKNKKGRQKLHPLIALMAVAVVLGIGFIGYQATQTAVEPTVTTPAVTATGAVASDVGDAATVKFRAYDQQANNKGQVAATLYVRQAEDGALLNDGTAMSASDSTNSGTTIGKTLEAVAFSSTYYGELASIPVVEETQQESLNVHTVETTSPHITLFDDGSSMTLDAGVYNLTIGADQTNTIDKIHVEVNTSNNAYNLKAIAFNVTGATDNLDNIVVGGLSEGTLPTRLKDHDYYWELPDAVLLEEFDTFETGTVQFEASGTNPNQDVNICLVDEGYYRSIASGKELLTGVEDDQSTPSDVGGSDWCRLLGIA